MVVTPGRVMIDVSDFQRRNVDHLGRPLAIDGICGPATRWALAVATLCAARRTIIETAQAYLGLIESPPHSNCDERGHIQYWLDRCGCNPGEPWCAAFASFCLASGLACKVGIGGAQHLGGNFPATAAPLAGDLFWFKTSSNGHGHCGIVTGVSPEEVMTIEGNSDDGVRCLRRRRSNVNFSRTVEDVAGEPPAVIPGLTAASEHTR